MADQKVEGTGSLGDFVHLHLHTEYSLLDGGNQIDKLVNRVAELGMKSVGITDHGNIFGAVALYTACKDKGIKPILGVEAYVTPPGKPRTDRTYTGGGEGGFHLVLLAMNNTGWQNLMYLCSEAYLTGFYYKPRIDRELLAKHAEGLVAINGHLGSEIGDHLLNFHRSGDKKYWDLAVESATWHAKAFANAEGSDGGGEIPRFYVELQHHVPEQNAINPMLIKLARELKLPLVCDNDAHFLKADDHDTHDTLICISTGRGKNDPDRMKYPPDLFVKSPGEMQELMEPYGEAGAEAMANTVRIAQACNVTLAIGANNSPMVRLKPRDVKVEPKWDDPVFGGDLTAWYKAYCATFEVLPFAIPDSASDEERKGLLAAAKTECDEALRLLSEGGFRWRYGRGFDEAKAANPKDDYVARLERELKILADKNISAYFLIVWDFVNWGRQKGIPSNARGSGVGTMAGYVLGLSNACPVRYGLLFERFTDPDRSEYPDIDIDLCQDGRGEVINYVRQKYGHVAQIITFGTLGAKAALRDVGRVMEIPLGEVDRLCKLIPAQLNISLQESYDQEAELKKAVDGDERYRLLYDHALALEGHTRHAGVHAAGVIVATRPLHQIVPLYKQPGNEENEIITQWDGPTCEKMGLLKMDFLGLRTLSIIERAKKLIRESLSEDEIWAAVGKVQKCKSAGVQRSGLGGLSGRDGEVRSGGFGDGGAGNDVSGVDRLAAGHGSGASGLSGDAAHASSGAVRLDQSDAARGDVGADEHRRGVRKDDAAGATARAAGSPGVTLRGNDGVRIGRHAGNAEALRGSVVADVGSRSAQSLVDAQSGTNDRAGAETRGNEVAPSAALLHSCTPALSSPHPLDLDRIDFSDQRVFELFRRGETTGVFQFESGGMRRLLTEMKPDRLEDLIAANALFRPGPMDLIPDYNRRKHGTEEVPKVHEVVERYTAETYGVMVYQEQVMQIVHGLGGIKLRDAYTLIKNISKKKHDKIEKERPKFVEGAGKQGLPKDKAQELFELILKFAGYGFNKSHSTGYAIVAYQTAYLKTYFPNQYMSAFLTYESQANKVSEWIPYLEDCRRTRFLDPATGAQAKVGVEVKPPDINLSGADFTVVFNEGEVRNSRGGHVRFGLRALKGVGDKAIEHMMTHRVKGGPFTSLYDFTERLPYGVLNKTALESLIKCGAFDSVHGRENRAAMIATIERALTAGQKAAADKASGQSALFGGGPATAIEATVVPLAKAEPWNEAETLTKEKEVLGFYVSSHPLERWRPWYSAFVTHTTATIKDLPQDTRVVLAAMIQEARTIIIKNGRSAGQKMAILTVEDPSGAAECVVFSDYFAKYGHLAAAEAVLFVLGRIDLKRGDAQIMVDRLVPIDGLPLDGGRLRLFVDEQKLNGGALATMTRVADLVRGSVPPPPTAKDLNPLPTFPVEIVIGTSDRVALLAADPKLRVNLKPDLLKAIAGELGDGMVKLAGGVALDKVDKNDKPKWGAKRKASQDDDE